MKRDSHRKTAPEVWAWREAATHFATSFASQLPRISALDTQAVRNESCESWWRKEMRFTQEALTTYLILSSRSILKSASIITLHSFSAFCDLFHIHHREFSFFAFYSVASRKQKHLFTERIVLFLRRLIFTKAGAWAFYNACRTNSRMRKIEWNCQLLLIHSTLCVVLPWNYSLIFFSSRENQRLWAVLWL